MWYINKVYLFIILSEFIIPNNSKKFRDKLDLKDETASLYYQFKDSYTKIRTSLHHLITNMDKDNFKGYFIYIILEFSQKSNALSKALCCTNLIIF